MRCAIDQLLLADFRSHERVDLAIGGETVFLFGLNGAGKTNILEAISLLSPGRGLRGATLADLGRRTPGETAGRPWSVSAGILGDAAEVRIGVGVEAAGDARRIVRIDGESAPPGRLTGHIRPIWLTPAQDRLFLDGATDRRRFLDRLVFAGEPAHAGAVNAYDRALRERLRLLTDGPADPAWLAAVEARMGRAGAAVAAARSRTVLALGSVIGARAASAFPKAELRLTGKWEALAAQGLDAEAIAAGLADALIPARARDAAAGKSLVGPHRCDLLVTHAPSGRPAADCSTGEQKALVLGLVLAQAARLSGAHDTPNPVLLLDEVAAHLDGVRRAALFDEIEALSLQAFLTGADETLFETLRGRALGVHVEGSRLTELEA